MSNADVVTAHRVAYDFLEPAAQRLVQLAVDEVLRVLGPAKKLEPGSPAREMLIAAVTRCVTSLDE